MTDKKNSQNSIESEQPYITAESIGVEEESSGSNDKVIYEFKEEEIITELAELNKTEQEIGKLENEIKKVESDIRQEVSAHIKATMGVKVSDLLNNDQKEIAKLIRHSSGKKYCKKEKKENEQFINQQQQQIKLSKESNKNMPINWQEINTEFTEELQKNWEEKGFDYDTTKEWLDIGFQPQDAGFCAWLRDEVEMEDAGEFLNNIDGEEVVDLREQYQEYLTEQSKKVTWQLILQLRNKGFGWKEIEEWINVNTSNQDSTYIVWLRDIYKLTSPEYFNCLEENNDKFLREQYQEYLKQKWDSIPGLDSPKLQTEWIKLGFSPEETEQWINVARLQITEAKFAQWLRNEIGASPAGVAVGFTASGKKIVEYLRDGYSKLVKGETVVLRSVKLGALGSIFFPPINDNGIIGYLKQRGYDTKKVLDCGETDPQLFWQELEREYVSYFSEWAKYRFSYEEYKKWLDVGLKSSDADYARWLRDVKNLNFYQVLNHGNKEGLRGEYKKHLENELLGLNYEEKTIDAQKWLEANYPKAKAKLVKELNLMRNYSNAEQGFDVNLEGYLNLKKFTNLEKLICDNNKLDRIKLKKCQELKILSCQGNLLTSLDFLSQLPCPEKLVYLDISNNNIASSDLSVFSRFTNLETLKIGAMKWEKERVKRGIYNRFDGSLRPLQKLTKLKRLDIRGTDIDNGLEYLADSVEEINCSSSCRKETKVKKIANELWLYEEKDAPTSVRREQGNYRRWREINKSSKVDDLLLSDLISLLDSNKDEIIRQTPWELASFTDAQQWLDNSYPSDSEKREVIHLDISKKNLEGPLNLNGFTNVKELNCGYNKISNLNVSDCLKIEKLFCNDNKFTDLQFLSSVNSWNLVSLNITDNNIASHDLSEFSRFTNLGSLWIGNSDKQRIKKNCYNRLYGSLESLKDLNKLHSLYISGTHIDKGLEYLPNSLKELFCEPVQKNMAVKKIYDVLQPYEKRFILSSHYVQYGIDVEKWRNNDPASLLKEKNAKAAEMIHIIDKNENDELDWIRDREIKSTGDTHQTSPQLESAVDFKTWLDKNYPKEARKEIEKLNFPKSGKEKLSGHLDLRDFVNLKELDCSYSGDVTSIVLSNCPKLVKVNCSGANKLKKLDLSNYLELRKVSCFESGLIDLNVSNCPQLEVLDCRDNQLSNLVFSSSLILNQEKFSELKDIMEVKRQNEDNFKNLAYLDISDNRLLFPDLKLISVFPNLEELIIGPSGKKRWGEQREKKIINLKPLEGMRNLRKLTINGIGMDKDLKYLRIFDYNIKELKNQREKGAQLILEEWARKIEKKSELVSEYHEKLQELIFSRISKVEEVDIFATWWNPNCAVVTSEGSDGESKNIWLVVYEKAFGKVEEIFGVIEVSENLAVGKIQEKIKEIKEKLNGENPITALYTNINFPLQTVMKKTYFLPSEKNELAVKEIVNPDDYLKPLDMVWRKIPWTNHYHVGIYLGNKQIVHISAHSGRKIKDRFGKFATGITSWDEFLKATKNELIRCHLIVPFKKPEKIVEHIVKAVFSRYAKEEYNLLKKNCEHFVTLCVCGVSFSEQADKVKLLFGKTKLDEAIKKSDEFFEMLALERNDKWLEKIDENLNLRNDDEWWEYPPYKITSNVKEYRVFPRIMPHNETPAILILGSSMKHDEVKPHAFESQKISGNMNTGKKEVEGQVDTLLAVQIQLVEMIFSNEGEENVSFVKEQLEKIKKTTSKDYEISIEKINSLCELQKRITELRIRSEVQQASQIEVLPKNN
ncbi:protein of unknown function (L domain-like) [endosymbiont DhMRE of Dentiscutata heterogama]|uniref:lecithin retinol acyltransferase family protein n=1 Tax=endosymbiont DhMRE of Dentiscutata heterogama TaxID=1609546 RepID=UPI000638E6A5|nr:lecithin retinol acyltransferase family protein [endosymbiont DhMRE of Dentiscutata heterogama]CFW92699.1 protein of unknown function (L domain-like) [endosymbiont DhMRE of Dentiscutata heterogama]